MAGTQNLHNDSQWAWACPYCGVSNDLDAPKCVGCGSQLRDPDEDDLFGTVATENAQVIESDSVIYKETVWSTEAPTEDDVIDGEVEGPPAEPTEAPKAAAGPFSATQQTREAEPAQDHSGVFGASPSKPIHSDIDPLVGRNPFAAPETPDVAVPPAAAAGPAPVAPPPEPAAAPSAAPDPFGAAVGVPGDRGIRPTPDENGLFAAVESLGAAEREGCAVPIAVCGALLEPRETVLGCVAGQLLGHPAVIVLTNSRAIIANARRWKPLIDVFIPGGELTVHTRNDSEVASLTFIQGDRLTGVDSITNVAAALQLADRIKGQSEAT